jgi:hypothetical protein
MSATFRLLRPKSNSSILEPVWAAKNRRFSHRRWNAFHMDGQVAHASENNLDFGHRVMSLVRDRFSGHFELRSLHWAETLPIGESY